MKTFYGPRMAMGDMFVRQPLPTQHLQSFDPFLLLHHGDTDFEAGGNQEESGVPPHPHRGFYPVSFVFSGAIHHRDSLGNDSVIEQGGVQWVSAGKGIVHSERPSKEIAEKGGKMELIQLWINTPAKHKMDEPEYFGLQRDQIPSIQLEHGIVSLVSGIWNGKKGSLQPPFDLNSAMLFTDDDQDFVLKTKGQKQLIYVLEGVLTVNGTEIEQHFMGISENENELKILAKGKTKALILSADPINEPVVSHGPFVMTNNREIYQAIEDFQNGKMGNLVEDFE
jgi:hypothetical protein